MRLSAFAFVSALVLSGMVSAQDGPALDLRVAIAQPDGVTPSMKLAFANRTTDATGPRLELDAKGECRHFVFLAVGARGDVAVITSLAIMAQPVLILPLAVYQAHGPESYPIINHSSIPTGVEIYLQGVAFPLAECGAAAVLSATDVLRLFRAPAIDTLK